MAPNLKENGNSFATENTVGSENPKKLELVYQGYAYDVTSFVPRHPGGKIIEMYLKTREDSFNAIQQFHFRSIDRVQNIMKSLPRRPLMANNDPAVRTMAPKERERYEALDQDFWKLFNDCKNEGLFQTNRTHIFFRILEVTVILVSLLAVGYGKVFSNSELSPVSYIIGYVLLSIASGIWAGRCGYLVHESGHNSLTGSTKIDDVIAKIAMGIGVGLSASWWKSQHNRHHAMPNNIKHDVDMKTLPLIAFNSKVVKNPEKFKNSLLLTYQKYFFATLDIYLVGFHFSVQSFSRAVKKLQFLELLCMSLHYTVIYSIGGLLGVLIVRYLGGAFFLVNFALNHTHLPVTTEPVHWVEYSLSHTANIRSGLFGWVDYWMGYLNYQIEHHLMPAMPQYKNWLVRDRVKALAKKHNLQYTLISYTDAMKMTFANLSNVSKELREAVHG